MYFILYEQGFSVKIEQPQRKHLWILESPNEIAVSPCQMLCKESHQLPSCGGRAFSFIHFHRRELELLLQYHQQEDGRRMPSEFWRKMVSNSEPSDAHKWGGWIRAFWNCQLSEKLFQFPDVLGSCCKDMPNEWLYCWKKSGRVVVILHAKGEAERGRAEERPEITCKRADWQGRTLTSEQTWVFAFPW